MNQEGRLIVKEEKNIELTHIDKIKAKEQIYDTMLLLTNMVLKEAEIPNFLIKKIGVGVPGIVEENKVVKCDKFQIENWDLAGELQKYYGVEVTLQNDAVCAAMAEKEYGNLKETQKATFLCIGTGIGGANIIENKVMPAEYGHMIIEKNGRICHCQNQGCFETYASMRVLKNELLSLLELNEETTSEKLKDILLEEKENKKVNEYIEQYLHYFAIGIHNIISIFHPDTICLGGSFVHFEKILYPRLLQKIEEIPSLYEVPKIVLAKLGNEAGIIGASLY